MHTNTYQAIILLLIMLPKPTEAAWNAILLDSASGTQLYNPLSHTGQISNVNLGLSNCDGSTIVTMSDVLSSYEVVYIMGGFDCDYGGPTGTSTISFSPVTNTTLHLADMNMNRTNFVAAPLPKEGAIIVCGGYSGVDYTACERYNTYLNEWTFTQSLPLSGANHYSGSAAVTLLENVYLFGGYDGSASMNVVLKRQIDGQWVKLGNMPIAVYEHGAVAIGSDSAMVCGGVNTGRAIIGSCYIYSAATDQWTTGLSLTQPRYGHTLLHYNGRLWCLGGADANNIALQTAEVYDEFTGWGALPPNQHLYNTADDIYKSIAAVSA